MTPGISRITPVQFSDSRGKMTFLHKLHPENRLEKDPASHLSSHGHVWTNYSGQWTQPGLFPKHLTGELC